MNADADPSPLTPTEPAVGGLAEFLLVGGATLILFPMGWLLRRWVGLDSAELAVGFLTFHAASAINDPHFAVTYLLFYRGVRGRVVDASIPRAQRARYVVAGAIVPLALAVWGAWAISTSSAAALGWMIQLMFLLVGWHYVKQGYGVLAVLSARRGVRITDGERRALLFHCYAGWAYAWASPSMRAIEAEEKGVVYVAVAHPRALELLTLGVFGVSTLVVIWVLARRATSGAPRLPFGPLLGLLVTVWSWTIFSGIDPLMVYLIPALHSIQYLYFVWLRCRNEARASEGPPTFGKPVAVRLGVLALSSVALGWLLFRGGPAFLDGVLVARRADPGAIGPTPYLAASFAAVNIHHYFMDHAIWRREHRETRFLVA